MRHTIRCASSKKNKNRCACVARAKHRYVASFK